MTVTQVFLLNTWFGLLSAWLFILWAQFRVRRDGLVLNPNELGEQSEQTLPSLCVVIPARNEEDTIGDCLQSVLSQDYSGLSVRVVDDRSDDHTSTIVDALTRRHGSLSLCQIDSVAPGWLGKSNALWKGTRDLDADWICFLDSDCRLIDARSLRAAMTYGLENKVDLLSLWPRQAAGGFWEHMLIPLCGGIIAMWFGSPKVNDPGSRKAFANGQFLLIRRETYERVGGHQSVRNAIIEDVPFAEYAKAHGARCRVASGLNLVSVRMYTGFKAIRDGWSRIYLGALRSGTRILLSALWLLFGSLPSYVVLAVLGIGWVGQSVVLSPFVGALIVLAVVHLSLMMTVSYRFWGMGGCPRRYLWLYPVSVLIVIWILLRAWRDLIVRRRVVWRDVSYVIDRRGCIVH